MLVCVGPVHKPKLLVFSCSGSNVTEQFTKQGQYFVKVKGFHNAHKNIVCR